MKFILAGDIGGTKTNLAIYRFRRRRNGGPSILREARFRAGGTRGSTGSSRSSSRSRGNDPRRRLRHRRAGARRSGEDDESAVGRSPRESRAPARLGARPPDERSRVHGVRRPVPPPKQIHRLARGKRREGTIAVIAAGTGLGQAFLFWDGERHHPVATEGGTSTSRRATTRSSRCSSSCKSSFSRVSYERVLSGPGLVNIFSFFDEELGRPVRLACANGWSARTLAP